MYTWGKADFIYESKQLAGPPQYSSTLASTRFGLIIWWRARIVCIDRYSEKKPRCQQIYRLRSKVKKALTPLSNQVKTPTYLPTYPLWKPYPLRNPPNNWRFFFFCQWPSQPINRRKQVELDIEQRTVLLNVWKCLSFFLQLYHPPCYTSRMKIFSSESSVGYSY